MKTNRIIKGFFLILSSLILSSTIFAQSYPHIPISHDHNGGICWGYATVRAFHHFGDPDNTDCNPATAGGITTLSGSNFFDYTSWDDEESIDDILIGDIIVWTDGGEDHAAFIDAINHRVNYYGIILDQYDGSVKEGYSLQETIDGSEYVTGRGDPSGYYRLDKRFAITLDNEMGNNNGRNDEVQINSSTKFSAPHTYYLHWNSDHTLNGAMNDESYGGYIQKLDEWKYGATQVGTDVDYELTIAWNSTAARTYKAYYLNLYDITFRNYFPGASGYPGEIKVDGSTEDSPFTKSIKDGNNIQSEAINQTYNGVAYTFDEWDDASTTNPRTFSPTDDDTYTAYFTGKPISLYYYNLVVVGDPGDPVGLDWDEHPNDGVSYQIWRKVKHNGVMGDPEQIATRSHGTTSYTDYDYQLTDGYTDDLLYYDVRAYHSELGTSDPEWIDAFGEEFAKKGVLFVQDMIPEDFSISNFPNPFNPNTTISYSLIKNAHVTLLVYNISGQKIKELFTGYLKAGVYKSLWDGTNVNSESVAGGIYISKLTIKPEYEDIQVLTQKMLLAK